MKSSSYIHRLKKALAALLFGITLTVSSASFILLSPQPARADLPVVDVPGNVMKTKDTIIDTIKEFAVPAITSAASNLFSYTINQIAYQAAVALTSDCPGQKPCWNSKSFESGMKDALMGGLGEAIGTFSQESGLEKLGLNLCEPKGIDFKFKLNVGLGIMDEYQPPKPKCDFNNVIKNWESAASTLKPSELMKNVSLQFIPGQSPADTFMSAQEALKSQGLKSQELDTAKRQYEATAGGGFSGIYDMVSGRVKTPASQVKQEAENAKDAKDKGTAEAGQQSTNAQVSGNRIVGALIGAAATFAQVLASRLWNKMVNGMMSNEMLIAADPNLPYDFLSNPVSATPQSVAQAIAPQYAVAKPKEPGAIDPVADMSICPGETQGRTPDNCSIDAKLAQALTESRIKPMTVRELIATGALHGDWKLIPATDPLADSSRTCYASGYCEANLKKLRALRVLPIGWELAAQQAQTNPSKAITLSAAIARFTECDQNGHWSQTTPYCHLIDPDWVVKIPPVVCKAQAFGPTLLSPDSPKRNEECVDERTCLKQDDAGNCIGDSYGYCTQEKNVWRFDGDRCPAQFASCRTLTDTSTKKQVSYLLNTVDAGICGSDNVGCTAYSTSLNTAAAPASVDQAWNSAPQLYLNRQAEKCQAADDGCSAVAMLPAGSSLNLVRNPGFETIEDFDNNGSAAQHANFWWPMANVSATGASGYVSTAPQPISHGSHAMTVERTQSVSQVGIAVRPFKTTTVSAVFLTQTGKTGIDARVSLVFSDKQGTSLTVPASLIFTDSPGGTTCTATGGGVRLTAANALTKYRLSCSFMVSDDRVASATLSLVNNGNDYLLADDVQVEEGNLTDFHEQYGGDLQYANLKLPPPELGCKGEGNDPAACANYAAICRETEVGCDRYTPANGDPAVPAIVNDGDRCPAECVGYDVFKQEATAFERDKFPVYFIPKTAQACSAADVGCSEFTDIENEQVSYYKRVQQCQLPTDPETQTFYTWEGSDTQGYEIKEWSMRKTAATVPDQSAGHNASDVCTTPGSCANAGFAPCTALTRSAVTQAFTCNDQDTTGYCSRADIEQGDFDCREFYDQDGNRHYRRLSQTVLATADCRYNRITARTTDIAESKLDCEASRGVWNETTLTCVYRFTASGSDSCSAALAGCRAYKGNTAGNVRQVALDDFESGTAGWTPAADAKQSAESVVVGGHSLVITANATASRSLAGLAKSGRSYSFSFWARGSGNLSISVVPAAAATPSLPTITLSPSWKLYSVGPIFLNAALTSLSLHPSGQAAYIDNFVMREVQENIYAVANSWQTPASCNTAPDGTPAPLQMLGCREYRDTKGQVSTLRQFSQLCRDRAVGCGTYVNTQNTLQNPYSETWNAVCSLSSPATGLGTPCDYKVKDPTSGNPAAVLKDVCRVPNGETSCRFHYDGWDVSVPDGRCSNDANKLCSADTDCGAANKCLLSTPDRVRVAADERLYLAADVKYQCKAEAVGCRVMGQSHQVYEKQCLHYESGQQAVCTTVDSCSFGAYGCTSQKYDACKCTDTATGNFCLMKKGETSCTLSLGAGVIDRWDNVAIKNNPAKYDQQLCTEAALGCKEYNSADGLKFFKDPGDKICEYKEDIIMPDGAKRNGWFRKSSGGALIPCAPGELQNGILYPIAKQGDVSCNLAAACNKPLGCSCPETGTPVCSVALGQTGCGYQGWVGKCPEQFNRCEEFIDPLETSNTNPEGTAYYYMDNNKLDKSSCSGTASLKQGCVIFNQSSVPVKRISSYATYRHEDLNKNSDRVPTVNCEAAANVRDPACDHRCFRTASNGTDIWGSSCVADADCGPKTCTKSGKFCTADSQCTGYGEKCEGAVCRDISAAPPKNDGNVILKVRRDRECSEWLECRQTVPVYDENSSTKWKSQCVAMALCQQYQMTASGVKCVDFTVRSPEDGRFTVDKYADRDISYRGPEFSGYTVPNAYPPEALLSLTDKDSSPDYVAAIVRDSNVGGIITTCTNDSQCVITDDPDPNKNHGRCIKSNAQAKNGVCAFDLFGGPAMKADTRSAGASMMCRGYPESDSPYGKTVLLGGTYSNRSQPISNFKSANLCLDSDSSGLNNACDCSYSRADYGPGFSVFKPVGTAMDNSVCTMGDATKLGQPCTSNASCAATGADASTGSCSAKTKARNATGWTGICIDKDYGTRINGTPDQYHCLQWLPVDQLSGQPDIYNQYPEAGFDPAIDAGVDKLLYCSDKVNVPGKYASKGWPTGQYSNIIWTDHWSTTVRNCPNWARIASEMAIACATVPLVGCTIGMLAGGIDAYTSNSPDYQCTDEYQVGLYELENNPGGAPPSWLWNDMFWSAWIWGEKRLAANWTTKDVHNSDVSSVGLSINDVAAIKISVKHYSRDFTDNAITDFWLTPSNGWKFEVGWKGSADPPQPPATEFLSTGEWTSSGISPFCAPHYDATGFKCGDQANTTGASDAIDKDKGCMYAQANWDNGTLSSIGSLWCVGHDIFASGTGILDRNHSVTVNREGTVTVYLREQCREYTDLGGSSSTNTPAIVKTNQFKMKLANDLGIPYGVTVDIYNPEDADNKTSQDIAPYGHVFPATPAANGVFGSDAPYTSGLPLWSALRGGAGNNNNKGFVKTDPMGTNPPVKRFDVGFAAAGNTYTQAELQKMFVQSYGRYGLTGTAYGLSSGTGWGMTAVMADAGANSQPKVAAALTAPEIIGSGSTATTRQRCYPSVNDWACEEDGTNAMTVDGFVSGQVGNTAGGGSYLANITYYGYADKDHMPLVKKRFDANGATYKNPNIVSADYVETKGLYKNQRGVIKPATSGAAPTEICAGTTEWGKTPESCVTRYFRESILYTCTASDLSTFPACDGNKYPCQDGSMCHFKPRVQFTDYWGVCSGSCSGLLLDSAGNKTVANPNGLCVGPDTGTNAGGGVCDSYNTAWDTFAGEIVVKP